MTNQPTSGSASENSVVYKNEDVHVNKLDWFRNEFRPHFNEWIFEKQLDHLVNSGHALVGFIFMSCVIDYLAGFSLGKKETKGSHYINFINEYFPQNKYSADKLYDGLRNGLVHMFTIKHNDYVLIQNSRSDHLRPTETGQVFLDAGCFRDDLYLAAQKYFDKVEQDSSLLDKVYERYTEFGFMNYVTVEV